LTEYAFVFCDNYKTTGQKSLTTEFSTRHLGDNLRKFAVVNTSPGVTRQVHKEFDVGPSLCKSDAMMRVLM